jgi:hypothetical protein
MMRVLEEGIVSEQEFRGLLISNSLKNIFIDG